MTTPEENPLLSIFRSDSERRALVQMSEAAGVSLEDWVATAARARIKQWLEKGFDIIDEVPDFLPEEFDDES